MPASDDLGRIPQDPHNPLTPQKVALGQLLYHETGIAQNPEMEMGRSTYSCSSCHFASAGFQAGRFQGMGEGGEGFGANGEGRRRAGDYPEGMLDVQPVRTPTAMNGAYQVAMLWNGQFGAQGINANTQEAWTAGTPKENNNLGYQGLETQAIAGLSVHRLVCDKDLIESLGYKELFDQAFPDWPEETRYSKETGGLAIAAYERTLLANQAPFQRWLKGEKDAMNEVEKQGAILFFGKAECVKCHTGPALNSMAFYALGFYNLNDCPEETFKTGPTVVENLGRGGFTGKAEDNYKFKVPQLYNMKDSPFFGHGASLRKLRDVVAYKNAAIPENPAVPQAQLPAAFHPLGLTEQEVDAITAFLQDALYDPGLIRYQPTSLPSGLCFPNNDPLSRQDLGCE
ncbi:MAG: cytochrome-c peroxidase [Phaeodactylibacter sp.]|nr:cytochrome-c peroxidase [Phaeodactylibacter sp.]